MRTWGEVAYLVLFARVPVPYGEVRVAEAVGGEEDS